MALTVRARQAHDRADRLRSEIRTIQRAAADDRGAAAQSRSLAADRERLVGELAAAEAAGTITRDDVDKQLERADREATAHLRNASSRERSAEVRDGRVADLERELAATVAGERMEELAQAIKRQDTAASAARRAIVEAAAAAAAHAEARDAAEQLERVLEQELADVAVDWPTAAKTVAPPFKVYPKMIAGNDSVSTVLPLGKAAILVDDGKNGLLVHHVFVSDELRPLIDLIVGA